MHTLRVHLSATSVGCIEESCLFSLNLHGLFSRKIPGLLSPGRTSLCGHHADPLLCALFLAPYVCPFWPVLPAPHRGATFCPSEIKGSVCYSLLRAGSQEQLPPPGKNKTTQGFPCCTLAVSSGRRSCHSMCNVVVTPLNLHTAWNK